MIHTTLRLEVINHHLDHGGSCAACGLSIQPRAGLSARYRDDVMDFGCRACLRRFEDDPTGRLKPDCAECSRGTTEASPLSEWSCY